MLLDRPIYAAIAKEPDLHRQVQMLAALTAETMERLAPVWVAYREAAAVDAKAAANLVAAHKRRHETFAGIIAMLPDKHLRVSREESPSYSSPHTDPAHCYRMREAG